jgi:hypothetical protein
MNPDTSHKLDSPPQSTLAARLRPWMGDIHAALQRGYSHSEVLAWLKKNGLELSPNTLKVYLARWRKANANTPTTVPDSSVAVLPVVATEPDSLVATSPAANTAPSLPLRPALAQDSTDLTRLRKQPVDLDALARQARQSRN